MNTKRIHATTETAAARYSGPYKSRKQTPEYTCWLGLKTRCSCRTYRAYKNYGGRGIKVCERWRNSFENFLVDMGAKPSRSLTLDRTDNDGDYCPENCRWATWTTQANNKYRAVPSETANPHRKLNALQVRIIRRSWLLGVSTQSLANAMGVSQSAISRCARGETWKHVARGAT